MVKIYDNLNNELNKEKEIFWKTITQLELDLITSNQQFTDAELQIEILKSGDIV